MPYLCDTSMETKMQNNERVWSVFEDGRKESAETRGFINLRITGAFL